MGAVLRGVVALIMASSSWGWAEPWVGYGATKPVPRYEQDPGHEKNYVFGVTQALIGYQDPPFSEGLQLPSPFQDHRFDPYNLVIIINDNETEKNPQIWGPPQTMRVYSRQVLNSRHLLYYWNISTGQEGAATRKGYYRPQGFSSRHWSGKYDAPMLSSVFFDGGRALHSSLSTADLRLMGKKRSSQGCVHIEDHRALELFHLIGHSGYGPMDLFNNMASGHQDSEGQRLQKQGYRTLIVIH